MFQSPPPSPTLESARQRAFTSIPKGTGSLQRSHTVSASSSSGYSTLRKKGSGGPAPKPVGIPTLTKSPTRSLSNTDVPYDAESHESFHSSSGNVSNFSSMSSLSTTSADQMSADTTTGEQGTATFDDNLLEQVAYYTQHDAKALVSGIHELNNLLSFALLFLFLFHLTLLDLRPYPNDQTFNKHFDFACQAYGLNTYQTLLVKHISLVTTRTLTKCLTLL